MITQIKYPKFSLVFSTYASSKSLFLCAEAITSVANPDTKVLFTNPYHLLGDLSEVRNSEIVIICDISLIENRLADTLKKFSLNVW